MGRGKMKYLLRNYLQFYFTRILRGAIFNSRNKWKNVERTRITNSTSENILTTEMNIQFENVQDGEIKN